MSDIIERLSVIATVQYGEVADVMFDAANEIEKLRGEILRLQQEVTRQTALKNQAQWIIDSRDMPWGG